MPIGKKKCLDCNKPYVFSKGLCQYCWKIKFGKPIKKVSDKQSTRNDEYKIVRDEFMLEHPICQANINNSNTRCSKNSTDCHHMAGKVGGLYLDKSNFLAVCRACHGYIELHPNEAKELGFSKNRL